MEWFGRMVRRRFARAFGPAERQTPGNGRNIPPFLIRDPLLGDIRLTPLERRVVDSDLYQRLRGVKQLGTALFIYPSAMQTRFVHGLGNLEIIAQMFSRALENADATVVGAFLDESARWLELDTGAKDAARAEILQVLRLVGLCHDVGHFPMGHVLEDPAAKMIASLAVLSGDEKTRFLEASTKAAHISPHEYATLRLLELHKGELFREPDERIGRKVIEVLRAAYLPEVASPDPIAVTLGELVSSEIDSDRAEYLRRDSQVSGAGYGRYDPLRLTGSFTLVRAERFYFRPSTRGLEAIESFLQERVKAYVHLYFHRIGVLMDALLQDVLEWLYLRADDLTDGLASPERERLQTALDALPPAAWSFERFAGPGDCFDDARLWVFLRGVSAVLESFGPAILSASRKRVRTYLRVIIRRRPLWVSLWKHLEEFRRRDSDVFPHLADAIREKKGQAFEEKTLRDGLADMLNRRAGIPYGASDIRVLNFIAQEARPEFLMGSSTSVASELEGMLGDDRYVVIGHRGRFSPLKDRGYKVVADTGELRYLREISGRTLEGLQAGWYDGIQLWVYVLTPDERTKSERQALKKVACARLPEAVASWYRKDPTVSWHPDDSRATPRST
jgi:HD superfamily phosphohydrolase